jgi:hypothetical protein
MRNGLERGSGAVRLVVAASGSITGQGSGGSGADDVVEDDVHSV